VQPTSPVIASATSNFTIRFSPSSIGTINGSVTIDHNDATGSEDPYVINLTGMGVPSNNSDIIIDAAYVYSSDIDYTAYQGDPISNTSHSVGVMKFDIRDGGASNDDDNLPTILDDITFSNIIGIDNIRDAALFDGNTFIASASSISGSDIIFTDLPTGNTEAADDGEKSLTLRVSFETTVTDNEQMSFTITDANVTAAGSNSSSTFGSFTDVISSTTGDRNRIEVVASTIAWNTQPQDAQVMMPMNAFSVDAVDANGNTDFDESTCTIVLTTSGTDFSSSSPYSFSGGTVTISDAQFDNQQLGITITATAQSCLSSTAIESNSFDVLGVVAEDGDYRTSSDGTWPTGGTATWERYNSGSWTSSSAPASNTTNKLFIRHELTTSGAFAAPAPGTVMIIESGGVFYGGHNCTFSELYVLNGGIFYINSPSVDINSSSGTLTVYSGGIVVANSSTFNNADGFWEGTENFMTGSIFEIQDWDWDTSPGEESLVDNNPVSANSEGYYFGNIYFNSTLLIKHLPL
jgi:hypothetical protein